MIASLRPASALASVVMTVASTTTGVWISDGSDGLGQRVLRRLEASPHWSKARSATAMSSCGWRLPTPTPGPAGVRARQRVSPQRWPRPPTPVISCSSRRRWSTGHGPTTRCRSPRKRCCVPTSSSSTPANSARWSSSPTSGVWRSPGGPSRCFDRPSPWPPMARVGSPQRLPPAWGNDSARTILRRSSCTSTISLRRF